MEFVELMLIIYVALNKKPFLVMDQSIPLKQKRFKQTDTKHSQNRFLAMDKLSENDSFSRIVYVTWIGMISL